MKFNFNKSTLAIVAFCVKDSFLVADGEKWRKDATLVTWTWSWGKLLTGTRGEKHGERAREEDVCKDGEE